MRIDDEGLGEDDPVETQWIASLHIIFVNLKNETAF